MTETLVRMPKLADTLVEGTLGQWLKQVGDAVRQGEPLASIETDKVTTELTSPAAGTLLEVLVSDGQTVPIETPIARIGEPAPAEEPSRAAEAAAEPAHARWADEPVVPPTRATPVAAKLLAEHGLKPEDIQTASGRLRKADVLSFIARESHAADAAPAADGNLVPLTSMRRAIAEHMLRARQTIPHGQSVMDVDLSEVVAWREAHKDAFRDQEGANLTFTILFVRALAGRLAAYLRAPADVGVAVALDAGLIVPVLRGAESLRLGETARAIADLAARARAGKLTPDETQGARMTLTNVGSFGNLTASPIVPLGQLGILGPGLVERRPLPAPGGGIHPGWRCLLSLMFDRRAFDDYAADRFLRGVIDELTGLPTAASG
jgi:2-oxoisovalerate dehydrogenase E2 component (dihydrolipoyl transacylase)